MSLFHSDNPKEKDHKGILGAFSVDNIKWEPGDDIQASFVVKKYPYEDFPNGSYLHVAQSQIAIFTNNMTAGSSLDSDGSGASQVSVFVGPCKIKLDTGDSRFAPFRNVTHALTDGSSAFHSIVYFVNTTYMNELKWGTTDPILVQDPEEDVNVHVRAYGLFGAHIEQLDGTEAPVQARKFITRVVGTRDEFTREELTNFMRAKILEYVPDLLAKAMIDKNIGILKLPAHLSEFSDIMKDKLCENFNTFGLTLDNFSFHSIKPLEQDLEAINQMKIQRKRAKLEAEGNAVKMDIESAAMARKREREGYTYQQERGMDVMHAAASNESAGSAGFMGAGMGLGMGVGIGGAVGAGFSDLAKQTVNAATSPAPAKMKTPDSAETVKCPACGFDNPKGAKFCLNCGEKLNEEVPCPNCGKMLPKGAKFCMFCGAKIGTPVCPNCGAELQPGAKFCMNCGTKIE
jgi:membrane protease subunit (stomatin/prohibitin family)